MFFATTKLSCSTERTPSPHLRRLRPGPRAQRRRGRRLELERVEDRCLLSSYSITPLTYPGGYLHTAAAINNLGQVAGRGSYPINNAVIWQNGSITNLDPQQVHGVFSYAVDLTNPAPGHEADVQVVGGINLDETKQDIFLWAGGTMYDTLIPFSNPSVGGNALAISNAGVVAGSYAPGGDPSQNHAFVWIDSVVHNHVLDPGELRDLNSLFPNATSSSAEDVIDATASVPHRQIVANAYVPVKGGGQQWRAYLLTDKKDNGFASGVQVAALGTLSGALSIARLCHQQRRSDCRRFWGQRLPLAGRCDDEPRPLEQSQCRIRGHQQQRQLGGSRWVSQSPELGRMDLDRQRTDSKPQGPDPQELGLDLAERIAFRDQ